MWQRRVPGCPLSATTTVSGQARIPTELSVSSPQICNMSCRSTINQICNELAAVVIRLRVVQERLKRSSGAVLQRLCSVPGVD